MAPRKLGPWRPDSYSLNSELVSDAKGVLPGIDSYAPWPGLSAISAALTGTCTGATLARLAAGSLVVYAGTTAKIEKFASVSSWTDVTRATGGAYAVPSDGYWRFAQFGTNLIAVNGADAAQTINVDSGSNFAALGGSPPTAKYVQTVGDHLFLFGLTDNPNRVRWSGTNDSTFWTVGQQDSDYQDFADGGEVNGVTNLETGLIFQQNAVRKFVPVNSRAIYEFYRIENARGLFAPNSLVTYGHVAYYLSEDGFFSQSADGASDPIGLDQVNDWFTGNANLGRPNQVIGVADPTRPRIFWLFATSGVSTAVLDHVLCYDIRLKQFTHAEISAAYILAAAQAATTMDALGSTYTYVDNIPFSLDAAWLQGGTPYLACFDSDDKLAFFSGDNMAASFTTSDFQVIPMRRAYVRGIEPYTDADNITVKVGRKERAGADVTYDSGSTMTTEGMTPHRSSGRYHRVQLDIDSAETWDHIAAFDVQAVDEGER